MNHKNSQSNIHYSENQMVDEFVVVPEVVVVDEVVSFPAPKSIPLNIFNNQPKAKMRNKQTAFQHFKPIPEIFGGKDKKHPPKPDISYFNDYSDLQAIRENGLNIAFPVPYGSHDNPESGDIAVIPGIPEIGISPVYKKYKKRKTYKTSRNCILNCILKRRDILHL